MVYSGWTLFLAGSMTGPGSSLYTVFGGNPNYTGMQQLLFDNANEKAFGGSVAYDFGSVGLSGLSAGVWYTQGGAPSTAAPMRRYPMSASSTSGYNIVRRKAR